jgi:hypothetical protein
MKRLITIPILTLLAVLSPDGRSAELPPGAALVKRIEWKAEKLPASCTVQTGGPNGMEFVAIVNPEAKPADIALWTSDAPGIKTKSYALRGMVRSHDVKGTGYLNLWNEFHGPGPMVQKTTYFSRTLADSGPLQKITGSSDWRAVWIPFDAAASKSPIAGLELDLVLAGSGTVDLSDLELLEFADAGAMWSAIGISAPVNPAAPVPEQRRRVIAAIILAAAGLMGATTLFLWRRRRMEIRRMRAMDLR